MAMNQLFTDKKPDILVSGINHGSNASVASIYSGTLGAAAEGTVYGIPSIGFSLASHDPDADFTAAKKFGRVIVEQFMKNPPTKGIYLNVNFPPLPEEKIKGIRFSKQGKGQWIKEFEQRKDPYGFNYYWMTGEFSNIDPLDSEADHNVISSGYISVVPHNIDNTDYKEMERLSSLWQL
jgi:5'-nucleotidase